MRLGQLSLPRSWACGNQSCQTCEGFSGDYDTYLCGCSCHWCHCGYHKRGKCPDHPGGQR